MAEHWSDEVLELLLRGDDGGGAGSSGVQLERPSLTNNLNDGPLPSLSALPTYYAAGKETASESEMASWLSQVFEQEPQGAATAATTKSEGGNAVAAPSNNDRNHRTASAGELATGAGAAECRRGRRGRSSSAKAAEKRRRDMINGKLRTLQQLMPWCSKADKASTLEEVIKYMKSLQNQVQVMSANGYNIPTPTPIFPLGVMQLPAGDVLGGQTPVTMLPQYPVFPTQYASPHHGTPSPLPLSAPYTPPCHPGETVGPSGGQQQLAHRRHHLLPNGLTMPSHRNEHIGK